MYIENPLAELRDRKESPKINAHRVIISHQMHLYDEQSIGSWRKKLLVIIFLFYVFISCILFAAVKIIISYSCLAKLASLLYNLRVPLANGGSLVIEQTEALVSIDVNGGHGMFGQGNSQEKAILDVNLAAARQVLWILNSYCKSSCTYCKMKCFQFSFAYSSLQFLHSIFFIQKQNRLLI